MNDELILLFNEQCSSSIVRFETVLKSPAIGFKRSPADTSGVAPSRWDESEITESALI